MDTTIVDFSAANSVPTDKLKRNRVFGFIEMFVYTPTIHKNVGFTKCSALLSLLPQFSMCMIAIVHDDITVGRIG